MIIHKLCLFSFLIRITVDMVLSIGETFPEKINTGYTVEFQWLKHLWNHENMFQTGVVQANECYS